MPDNGNIDNLNIQISAESDKAEKSLQRLVTTLEKVRDTLKGIGSADFSKMFSGTNGATKELKEISKGIGKLKKSEKGIKKIRFDIDLDKFDAAVGQLREKFKDAGKDFVFTGSTADLEKSILSVEKKLDRLFEKEDKLREIGANFNTQGFKSLEFDISSLTNKLDILRAKSEELKNKNTFDLDNIAIHGNELSTDTQEPERRTAKISAESMGYNKSAMAAVFGESFKDIENYEQAISTLGINASQVMNEISQKTENVRNRMKEAGLSAEQFEEYLKNIRIPEIPDMGLKKLQSELEKTERKLNTLETKSDNWAAKGIDPDSSKFRNLQEQIVSSAKYADQLRAKIQNLSSPPISGWKKIQSVFNTISQKIAQMKTSIGGVLGNAGKLQKGFSHIGKSVSALIPGFGKLNKESSGLRKNAQNGFGLGQMIKLSVIYSGIFSAISGIRNAIVAGSQNLAQYSSTFNASISSMMSALTKLKNAFAVAFAPIANVVAPYITAFINMISDALNKIGQFFAALTGKTFTPQAVNVVQDYAAGLQETSENMDNTADSAKSLEKALSVLSFDELNQLSAVSNADTGTGAGSGGGGAGELSPSDMFTTSPISEEIQRFADKIKGIFAKLFQPFQEAWENEGQNTINAAKEALSSIGELAKSVGSSFLEVWTNGTGTQTLTTLLQIAQNLFGVIGGIAQQFTLAWNEAGIGTSIIQNIFNLLNIALGVIKDITGATMVWAQQLDFTPLLQSINTLLVALQPLTQNIGAGLEWFWTNVLLPIGSWTIQEAVPTFLNMLSSGIGAVNSVITALQPLGAWFWENFLQPLGQWTGEVVIGAMGAVASLLDRFSTWVSNNQELVQGIVTVIGSFAAAWGLVSGALTAWNTVATLASGIVSALGAAIGFLTSPIGIAVAAIGGIIAAGVLLYQNWDQIKEAAGNLKDWVSEKFQQLIDFFTGIPGKIGEIVNNIVNWFNELPGRIGEAIGFVIGRIARWALDIHNTMQTEIPKIIDSVVSFFAELPDKIANGISSAISKVKEWASNLLQTVKEEIPKITEKVIEFFKELPGEIKKIGENLITGFIEGIQNMWENAKENVGEFVNGIIRGFTEGFDTHSPSRITEGIGENVGKGLINGIDSQSGDALKTVGRMADSIIDRMQGAMDNMMDNLDRTMDSLDRTLSGAERSANNSAWNIESAFSNLYIPLPHIDWDWNYIDFGDFSFSIPSFKIRWYAKGGLFTKATLAGIGEAGKEAVLPLENRRTMSMIADSIMESGNIGVDEETLANAVAQGVAMAMMNNQGNQTPITVYAELKTESDEVLARAVTRGQQKIDYRNNPTIRFGY